MDLFWKVSSKAKDILVQREKPVPAESEDEKKSETVLSDKSPNVEQQPSDCDRNGPPETEKIESEPNISSPISNQPECTEAETSETSSMKTGLIPGDIKDVSNKAVESAKTIGNLLYGFANKTGRTLTETAKHLKTTVEENTILGEFNKEQQAFASAKNSKVSSDSRPPWAGMENEDEVKEQILSLSSDRRNFLRSPPSGVQFDFDFNSMHPIAKIMLKEDPELEKMRFDIVPKLVNEENFWKNYFYRVSLVKQSSRLNLLSNKSSDSSTNDSEKSSPVSDVEALEKTAAYNEGFVASDESPTHEFVSDSFQTSHVSEEDIKQGMKMLGVTEKSPLDEWESEIQQELQEYEVVAQSNDDADWEKEMNQMLGDKAKDIG